MHRQKPPYLALIILIAMVLIWFAPGALAGSCSETAYRKSADQVTIVLACSGDTVDSYSVGHARDLRDLFLFYVQTRPGSGAAVPTAYTLDIQDGAGFSWLDLSARSATDDEVAAADLTTGVFPPGRVVKTVVLGDIGAAGETTIQLGFVK